MSGELKTTHLFSCEVALLIQINVVSVGMRGSDMQGSLTFARDNFILKIKFISKTVTNRYLK